MTVSGVMTRRPGRLQRTCLLMPCLVLLCLVWLVPLSFVQGRAWDGNWDTKRQATIRLGQRLPGRAVGTDVQAKMWTSQIKKATSAQKLVSILDEAVDGPIFNSIHASAAYTQLVAFKRNGALRQKDWDGAMLLRLHTRVEDMALRDQLGSRETANVVWSLGQLSEQFSIPIPLLAALVKSMPTKVRGMKQQELANCMWASSKLKDIAPVVLEMAPAIVAEILNKAKDLDTQGLSNCLWAFAQLKDVAPGVLEGVPALVAQIAKRATDMGPQALSNCLWASAQLKDVAPDVLEAVPALAAQIPKRATDMVPQALSNCLWASAQLKDVAPNVLNAVPAIVAEIPNKAKDMITQHLSNCLWSSAQLKDVAQVAPDVLEAVPAIAAQIPNKAKDMIPQHLSNCLWASAQLKDEVPKVLEIVPALVQETSLRNQDMDPQGIANSLEALITIRDSVPEVAGFLAAGGGMDDILSSAAKRLNTLLPSLSGRDLSLSVPVVVWACAKTGVYDGDLLASVAQRLGSRTKLSSLAGFNLCALSWSYQVLDDRNDFGDFQKLLMSEATSSERGLSEADVESCKLGRSRWNHA